METPNYSHWFENFDFKPLVVHPQTNMDLEGNVVHGWTPFSPSPNSTWNVAYMPSASLDACAYDEYVYRVSRLMDTSNDTRSDSETTTIQADITDSTIGESVDLGFDASASSASCTLPETHTTGPPVLYCQYADYVVVKPMADGAPSTSVQPSEANCTVHILTPNHPPFPQFLYSNIYHNHRLVMYEGCKLVQRGNGYSAL